MRILKNIIIIIFLFTISISCNKEVNKNNNTKNINQTPNYQKMEFHIKGMTCEIGCARLIESKLSKTKGIKFTKVSFQDSLGIVTFDTNSLSKKEIFKVVESIADGELYKVTDNKIVKEFTN